MWVFDGEQWTQDNGGLEPVTSSKPETRRPRYDELSPELQVIEVEIVPVMPNRHIPQVPLP
jgi:hypothetical protein